ncbi:MAG: T9SS type A sorting domain-containing protein, partial [Calditrichaeota bacterium]|nr:T9SS type A sorting domain-containing protein [Calditrichota bacterium]
LPQDIITGLSSPAGLAFSPDSARLFWTEMSSGQAKSANIDGTGIKLIADNLSSPDFITANDKAGRIAWSEAGNGVIKSAAYDGSDIYIYPVHAVAPKGIVIESPPDTTIAGFYKIVIQPCDTTIQVQNLIKFKALLQDSLGNTLSADARWSVRGKNRNPITDDGALFAYFPGRAKVHAKVDSLTAKAYLSVVDTTADTTCANKIRIKTNFYCDDDDDDGHGYDHKKKDHHRGPRDHRNFSIREGSTFTLAGLPHPFNILNGTSVYFPQGSLHEDVNIEIKMPKLHKQDSDSLEFISGIISAISFNVSVADSVYDHYYFDKPLSIAIPYKRGILKRYGIDPADLSLFYAMDSTTFDSLGISLVMVDSSSNRIYALVEHFSTLVVREKPQVTTAENYAIDSRQPVNFVLDQNYPNPFNPLTKIHYQLPVSSKITVTIYNSIGQKVETLFTGKQPAGSYSLQWDATSFASGVYYYCLESDAGFRQTRKLILLK